MKWTLEIDPGLQQKILSGLRRKSNPLTLMMSSLKRPFRQHFVRQFQKYTKFKKSILRMTYRILWDAAKKRSLFFLSLWGYFRRLTIYFKIHPGFFNKKLSFGCPSISIFMYLYFLCSKFL